MLHQLQSSQPSSRVSTSDPTAIAVETSLNSCRSIGESCEQTVKCALLSVTACQQTLYDIGSSFV